MVDKVTFNLDLPLDFVKGSDRSRVKQEVGTFLVEKILESVGSQQSPVAGVNTWPALDSKYKNYKKKFSSSPVANMELHGDMLNALKAKNTSNGIEIGFFNKKQALKADNHNKFSPESENTPVPKRQFIPNNEKDQTFKKNIMKEVAQIIKEYSKDDIGISDILREL